MSFTIELDTKLQEQAFAVIEQYGITPTELIKSFFSQIISSNQLNFEYPQESTECPLCAGREYNEETVRSLLAMDEEMKTAKRYDTVEEMMQDILGEVNG
ncbi:MAG: type II toxin-antitoxin system RelB/DinJ family antitoxin [Cardiobacteriaceae bacterium]|nr:type II toxin-antitoxin system RelB/DinJ family antitoxin [Cardiobacteriaceae bacterium]